LCTETASAEFYEFLVAEITSHVYGRHENYRDMLISAKGAAKKVGDNGEKHTVSFAGDLPSGVE